MELGDYLRILRRGWIWVAASVAIAVAAGAAVILVTTPQYSSSARLFVTTPLSDAGVAGAYQGNLFTQQRVRSYADIIESDVLAERVIADLGLSTSPSALASQVNARVVPDTVLLDVTVTDTSPEDAQALATAYAAEFITLVAEIEQPPSGGEPVVTASVVNSADLPTSPVSPQPERTLALAAILGLLVGIGVVILRDMLDTTVTSTDELGEVTDAPNLAVIAYDSDASDHPLIVEIAPRSPRAEAFRSLRTNLQFIDVDSDHKVIVVTSSVPSEGKTTTAVNLALALADAGVKVMLLEGDLRRPKVADYLGLINAVGITNLLVGDLELDMAVQRFGDRDMGVIACGPIPPNPSELLQSRAMDDLLKTLGKVADVVLIDAPPLLPVADAAILSALADGALLVTRHGRTKTEQIRQAISNLEQVGGRLLGTVLTMTPTKGPDAYRYGYGYGYGETPSAKKSSGNGQGAKKPEPAGRTASRPSG